MSINVVWLDPDPTSPTTNVSAFPSELDLRDRRLRVLMLDDDPQPLTLLRSLNLAGITLFIARRAVTAYAALLTRPFTYDAVFVDWRMDQWERLTAEFIASVGMPDTIPSGGLFLRVLGGGADVTDIKGAVEGGHAELLVSLASAQGALTILHSVNVNRTRDEEEISRILARGAHYFLPKIPNKDELEEVRQRLLSIAGNQRDKRFWRAIPLTTLSAILKYLRKSNPDNLRTLLTDFDRRGLHERHQKALSLSELNDEQRIEYLIGSLAWLRQQRFYCAERLFADAVAPGVGKKLSARLARTAKLLQPSLPRIGQPHLASAADQFPDFLSQIREAHRKQKLERSEEFLHIIVAPDFGRIDYYSSVRAKAKPASEVLTEHLGTTFGPRLTAAIDQNGVWPALKLSKLRHLLRSKRDKRIVHQGSVSVRCAEGVFGPSIDSLVLGHLLLRLTSESLAPLSRVQHAAEIGVGTGHLLCMLSAFAKNRIKLLIGSDISRNAIEAAERNLGALWSKKRSTPVISLALSRNALSSVRDNYLDLIISNPPYLPEPAVQKDTRGRRKGGSAIAGEEVIRHVLVTEGPRVLTQDGLILLVTSTLTKRMLLIAQAEANSNGDNWRSVELNTVSWVPLDLPEVQQDPKWIEFLLGEEAEHVMFDADSPDYPLRHGVVVTAYSRSEERIAQLKQYLSLPVTTF
jgi:methylase of polypeptide subunit release factors